MQRKPVLKASVMKSSVIKDLPIQLQHSINLNCIPQFEKNYRLVLFWKQAIALSNSFLLLRSLKKILYFFVYFVCKHLFYVALKAMDIFVAQTN